MSRGWRDSKRVDSQKSRGGSNKRRWGYLYKFGTTPVRVHFSKPENPYIHPDTGAELPFRAGMRYYVKWAGKNGAYIERDDPVEGKNCIIDAYKNPAAFGLDIQPIAKFSNLEAKVYYAVAGWVEEWFHDVLCENPKTGAKWRERQLCTGHGCEGCKENHPKVFGKKVYFEVAKTHWNECVFGWEERINSQCQCDPEAFIYIQQYNCPECKGMMQDVMNACFSCGSNNIGLDVQSARAECEDCHAGWSVYESDNAELSKAVNKESKCPHCSFQGYPVPQPVCTHCGDNNKEYSIFDCQMKISMTGTKDGKSKEMKIEDVSIQEPDEKLFNPKYQSDDDEWADRIAEGNKKPLNLDALLAAPSPDEQAQKLNVANPFTSSGGGQGYKSYSRHEEDGPQEPEAEPEPEGAQDAPEPRRRVGIRR
jgi:hypothetical protein